MAPPLGTDPDDVVDLLPKPFRFVAKVVDGILESVGEQIHEIEKRRRSDEYEFGLPKAHATGRHQITGKVTCVGQDPRGSDFLALGTKDGQVMLVDSKEHRVVVQKAPFGTEEEEEIQCLAMSSTTVFRLHPKSDTVETRKRPHPKLVVAGSVSPKILVYDVFRDIHGPALKPLCSVDLQAPPAEGGADGSPKQAPRPVVQLCCCGSLGALWIAVLLNSGSCALYLCPPGSAAERGKASQEITVSATIHEEEEAPQEGTEFGGAPVVDVPLYRFDLPSMVPIARQPEPPLSSLLAAAFCVAPERRAPPPAPPPLVLLLASTASNVVHAFSLQLPEPASVPQAEGAVEGAAEAVPPRPAPFVLGALAQPTEAQPAQPRRRWLLPARTTVRAVSGDGAVFAVGGSNGSVALFWTAPDPALKTMLPGHYAAVSAVSFSGPATLITVGSDSWVHLYSVGKQALAFRCLLTPPPTTPPGIDVITSPTLPISLVLDEKGQLRLFDTRLCSKLAAGVCHEAEAAEGAAPELRRVLASASGFCVLGCSAGGAEASAAAEVAPVAEADAEAEAEAEAGAGDADAAEAEVQAETTELYFFDHADVLPRLFSGISARVGAGADAAHLFQTLTAEEMRRPPGVLRTPPEVPGPASAPLTAANLERSQGGSRPGDKGADPGAADVARLVPDSWQATVKRYLRSGLNEKHTRQVRREQRMEQMRRELEQAT